MHRSRWLAAVLAGVAIVALSCSDGAEDGDAQTDDDVLASVTEALEAKHGWEPGAAEVSLTGVEGGQFAHGQVRDPEGSGAVWFAELVDGDWEIVWDGNGNADCASLDRFQDFPTSLLPQCFDASGNLVPRG